MYIYNNFILIFLLVCCKWIYIHSWWWWLNEKVVINQKFVIGGKGGWEEKGTCGWRNTEHRGQKIPHGLFISMTPKLKVKTKKFFYSSLGKDEML